MIVDRRDPLWLDLLLQALQVDGYGIVTAVLSDAYCDEAREAMYRARDAITADIGIDRLERAGEIGTLRLLMKYEAFFYQFLEIPELLAVINAALAPTSILHTQNGFILPSYSVDSQPKVFQNTYHRDFPRFIPGYRASISCLFAIDEFDERNGATIVVPGTHAVESRPSDEYLQRNGVKAVCPRGSMIVFDAQLYHAAGLNVSGSERVGINHQFTRSFFKQQIDYVRALAIEEATQIPERSKQLLGWYTRVVTSLDEYYQPQDRRLYRAGQG